MPASSKHSRIAATQYGRNSLSGGLSTRVTAASAASSPPPGKTQAPPRNTASLVRCSISTSGPAAPSRINATVAAGRGVWTAIRTRGSRRAARAVLVVLRLDEGAHALPVGVGELVELEEVAARAGSEVARAVDRDRLAGEPFAAVGHQEGGEVLQLLHAAHAAHGIHAGRFLEALAVGAQPLGRALRG